MTEAAVVDECNFLFWKHFHFGKHDIKFICLSCSMD